MNGEDPPRPAGEAVPDWDGGGEEEETGGHAKASTGRGFAANPDLARPLAFDLRRRIFERGAESLAASELIALVLGGGRRREGLRRAAEGVVRRRGVRGLAEMGPRDWRREPGIGRSAAVALAAALEVGRRVHGPGADGERRRVSRPRDAFEETRDLASARKEHLVGLYLDAQNGLIARETISIGSLNTTRTHPREILFPAVSLLALGFVLVHNHPSGCLEPSEEDVEFTRSVRRAAEMMGIELYDHVIVAARGFTSLRERGRL